jgi:hypothetical protein
MQQKKDTKLQTTFNLKEKKKEIFWVSFKVRQIWNSENI